MSCLCVMQILDVVSCLFVMQMLASWRRELGTAVRYEAALLM